MENNEKRVGAILDNARKKVKEITVIGGNAIASVGSEIKKLTACGTVCLAFCDEDEAAAARAEKSAAVEGFTVMKMRFRNNRAKTNRDGSCYGSQIKTFSEISESENPDDEFAGTHGGIVLDSLKNTKKINNKSIYDSLSAIPEDVRVYVGVGDFDLFEAISSVAAEKDARFVFIPARDVCGKLFFAETARLSESPFSLLRKEKLPKGKAADCLIFDTDLLKYNERALASAYGSLLSEYSVLFERFFACKIQADATKDDYIAAALKILDDFFDNYDVSTESFAEKLVSDIAAIGILDNEVKLFDGSVYALSMYANAADDSLSAGEYAFLYGYYLPAFYCRALNFKGVDLEFPPDKIKSVKYLDKTLGVSVADGIRAADAKGTEDFLKTEYLISEFRDDFLEFLKPITERLSACARNFRRIYSDAGYFLRECVTLEKMTAVLSACAITVDKSTFLSYLKSCGHLERYLPQSA